MANASEHDSRVPEPSLLQVYDALFPQSPKEHASDVDCAGHIDRKTGECRVCHVYHGDPCRDCGGRGFHRTDCEQMQSAVTP